MKVRVERIRGMLSIQDGGRRGQQHLGIPQGGFADRSAAQLANRLVDNLAHAPLLECALAAPALRLDGPCTLAWTGADMSVRMNDRPMQPYRRYTSPGPCVIDGGTAKRGLRGYLALGGTWRLENHRWRRSISPIDYLETPASRSSLKAGDEFVVEAALQHAPAFARPTGLFAARSTEPAEVALRFSVPLLGAQAHVAELRAYVQARAWRVEPASSRMGIRLEAGTAPPFPAVRYQALTQGLVSNPIRAGVVQLLPSGGLIVAHVDAHTLGGYPRIGFIDQASLDVMAQLKPGELLRLYADRS